MSAVPTADELATMVQIARLHYVDGLTKVQIAERMEMSRFRVSRLLDAALATGVVTITIQPVGAVEDDLAERLVDRFGLRAARAVQVPGTDARALYEQLGRAGAKLLAELATPQDVLGFDAGRTVSHIADYLSMLPPCDIVQLSGLAGTVQQTGLDILRRVTAISGGAARPLYAPMLALDASSADALRAQPPIAATMGRYPDVTIAVVSVGSWDPPISQVYDRLSPDERRMLVSAGVAAETCALMFDRSGRPVEMLDDRRIGISLAELHAVGNVIAVGGGLAKATAIRALLAAEVADTLVVDVATARALLEEHHPTKT